VYHPHSRAKAPSPVLIEYLYYTLYSLGEYVAVPCIGQRQHLQTDPKNMEHKLQDHRPPLQSPHVPHSLFTHSFLRDPRCSAWQPAEASSLEATMLVVQWRRLRLSSLQERAPVKRRAGRSMGGEGGVEAFDGLPSLGRAPIPGLKHKCYEVFKAGRHDRGPLPGKVLKVKYYIARAIGLWPTSSNCRRRPSAGGADESLGIFLTAYS
jgi:hypothetical protein